MSKLLFKKELSFFELYRQFINDSKRGRRLQPNGNRISSGTIRNYEYCLKMVQRFCCDKNFTLRIRPARKLSQRELFIEKNYWKKFYKRFTDYLYNDLSFYNNHAGQVIKNLKVFFNYLNKELLPGAGDFHKQFYVPKEDISIFPLMPEELSFLIYDKMFDDGLTPRMKEAKDFFVFGCTVALRVSDMMVLCKSNIRVINEQYYLSVRSIKTDMDTLVKLPPYAVKIIGRYQNTKGCLLPYFSKSTLNKCIKQLMEQAGFTHPVVITRSRRGKRYEIKKVTGNSKNGLRFCDVATTHTMRRTAITTMLSLGVPEPIVRKISGHAPGSKEFYRYVFWAQSYQDKETEKMFEKLERKSLVLVREA